MCKRLIATILFLLSAAAAYPSLIDLTEEDIYLRKGFDNKWLHSIPTDAAWLKIPGTTTGMRSVNIRGSGLPGLPKRHAFSLIQYPPETFTFITSFRAGDEDTTINAIKGLYIAYLGGAWELYLNGELLQSQWHVNEDGEIDKISNFRNILITLDPRIIRVGPNILAIKLRGDPTYVTTGLFYTKPYLIGDREKLAEIQSETVTLVLIFIYLLFGLYHLFLFVFHRKERQYLFFGLFAIFLFLYYFFRTRSVFCIIDNADILDRFELIWLYLLLPSILTFGEYTLFKRARPFAWAVWAFFSLLIIATIPTPLPFTYDIQMVWHASAVIPLLYMMIFQLGQGILATGKSYYSLYKKSVTFPIMKSIGHSLFRSEPGWLFFVAIVMFTSAITENIDRLYYHMGLETTKYGFLFFILVITLILINNLRNVYRKVDNLNEELEAKIIDLKEAYNELSHSEEKYRLLVEGSNFYIFTMDTRGRLINANKTLMKDMNIQPHQLQALSIADLLHDDRSNLEFTEQLVKDKISECVSKKCMVSLKVMFKSILVNEPREMFLSLEYIDRGRQNEILGKATSTIKDSLLQYLIKESQQISIASNFTIAEEITHRLVRNVEKYVNTSELNLLRITLREIIINAIEHGNLEISFDEKTKVSMDGDYLDFINKKLKHPDLHNRKVHIEYDLNENAVTYTIADDGKGFDYRSITCSDRVKSDTDMLPHGRGIVMAMNYFDVVEYMDNGNRVRLVKFFNGSPRD